MACPPFTRFGVFRVVPNQINIPRELLNAQQRDHGLVSVLAAMSGRFPHFSALFAGSLDAA
jgi:hypothetical protein